MLLLIFLFEGAYDVIVTMEVNYCSKTSKNYRKHRQKLKFRKTESNHS